jgi:hypothetical protein
MIAAVKRLILRSIERAGYIVLKRDDPMAWQIRFGGSQLHYDSRSSSGSGLDARITAQLQVLTRELVSAREAAARAEREVEKARTKLWQFHGVSPQPLCSARDGSEGSPATPGEVSSGTAREPRGHAPR